MHELPQGVIEVPRGQQRYPLWLTREIHDVLKFYAQDENTSITDVGNRILLGFLTEVYDFKTPRELHKRALMAVLSSPQAFHDAIASSLSKKKPRRRPLPLRRHGKLPFSSTKSDSSDQDNP